MDNEALIEEAKQFAKKLLEYDASGHDWWHVERVWRLTCTIAKEEKANIRVCQIAALFHDLVDDKLFDDLDKQEKLLKDWFVSHQVSETESNHIMGIIHSISFKESLRGSKPLSLEAKIVQDADRLDALGAIGICRTMAYSGNKGRLIHHPEMELIERELNADSYRNNTNDTAIQHFYDKLLKLKDLMNTNYGKQLAQHRHEYMINFLEEFYLEWDGKL